MRTADRLVRERYQEWEELEFLVGRSELRGAEINRLGALYRHAASDLALARRDFPDDRVVRYLESLTTRAHAAVFPRERGSWRSLGELLLIEFPRGLRAMRGQLLAAALAFLLPALVVGFIGVADPELAERHVAPGMLQRVDDAAALVEEAGQAQWVEIRPEIRAYVGAEIALNNILVSAMAFLGGLSFGVFTLDVLVTNGVMLGLLVAHCRNRGALFVLQEFVVAHGFLELSVIVVAGAAGLSVGTAWMRPGELTRGRAFLESARRGLVVLFGCAVALLIAGAVEGLLSPDETASFNTKLAVGLTLGGAFWLFVAFAGRAETLPVPKEVDP